MAEMQKLYLLFLLFHLSKECPLRSDAALRGQRLPGQPRVFRSRLIESLGEGLEHGFNDVVGIHAVQDLEVEVHHGLIGNRIEKVPHHFGVEVADPFGPEFIVEVEIGPTGKVDGTEDQSLVHGEDYVPVAADMREFFPDALF